MKLREAESKALMTSTLWSLHLRRIVLPVRLGCSAEERSQTQVVEFDVSVIFDDPPRGMVTDDIDDTVSYETIVDSIKKTVVNSEFRLIEHLAQEIFQSLQSLLGLVGSVEVTVRKVAPPIPELIGGAEFTIGD